jgi:hypothetical protein
MKLSRDLGVFVLGVMLSSLVIPAMLVASASAQTQESGVAIQRGYRTGYSDGYMAGYRDTIDSVAKNYTRHNEYSSATRAYNKEYGSVEDYSDGYRQGFESGYETGYDRRSFESTLPTGLKRRGMISPEDRIAATTVDKSNAANKGNVETVRFEQISNTAEPGNPAGYQAGNNAIVVIPQDTELIVELQEDLNTEQNREGDRFTAKIVSPSEITGATIEGRVSKILKPGRSELLLSFDRILLNDNRWGNFSGILIEVMPVKGDNIRRVDTEGTAIGKSSIKQDAIKVGGATGAGMVVGAVVGGPVGAAVGAGMGAAFGVGAVVIERGKHIRLNRNQQLRIKTAHETQIR